MRSWEKYRDQPMPILMVNSKPRPAWDHEEGTLHSYPVDATITKHDEVGPFCATSAYWVRVRYERPNGDIVCNSHVVTNLQDAIERGAGILRFYAPDNPVLEGDRVSPLEPHLMALLQELRGE